MVSFASDVDIEVGKVLKYRKINPVGEDIYLLPDGSIVTDESKIVKAQRIFLHNYYKPGGRGNHMIVEKYRSCPPDNSSISK